MAVDNSVGGLYIRLGLSLSELETGFITASQTVRQGIATLNRQQNIVRLKMETDLAGLDAVTDKAKILETQEKALTQALALQQDKLRLATAAYNDVAQSKRANSAAAKVAEAALERERLAVARLEQQLKSLAAQKVSLDTSQLQDNISRLNARIQNVKISAEIDTSKLEAAGRIFDVQKTHAAALTQELELQRQKLNQLREAMYRAANVHGADNVQTLQVKTNVLQQIQQINQLETKLRELSATDVHIQIRADSLKTVENNINQNIAQLNARIENVRVKTEVDVSKISSAASEFDRAKAQVQGLNRELTIQNQKLAEMQKALGTSVKINGADSVKSINLQTEIQKQIQAIDQLKAKISELNKIPPPKENKLLSGYLNIKGDAIAKLNSFTTAFSNLQGATSAADSAITAVLGVIGEMPRSVGLATAALVGLPLIFKGIENSIVDMMRATAAAGDATYVMSRGFQMSIKDTGKFVTMAKTAGADVNDLASTIKRVQQAIVRGGEDAKAEQWLRRYGESAFDASGHLKNLNDMTLTLSRALKRAQADGNGMAFILGTMRSASADAITAIEDAEDVYKQAATIVKAGLANPALAHEVQGNLNAMGQQAAQLGTNFNAALLPVANEIIPRMTERMGKMTRLIADNKDVILDFGRDFAEVWGAVEDTVDKVADGLSFLGKLARENRVVRQTDQKTILERYKDDAKVQNAKDLVEAEIAAGDYTEDDIRRLRARNDLYQKELKRTEQDVKAILAKRREEFAEAHKSILDKYKSDNSIKTATDLLNKLTDAEKEAITKSPSTFGSLIERVAALNIELQKLQVNAKATAAEVKDFKSVASDLSTIGIERQSINDNTELVDDLRKARKYIENAAAIRDKLSLNDYAFQKNDLQRWLQEQLPRDAEQSMEKYNAVMEEYRARDLQLDQEHADKLKQIRKSVDAEFKTELENRIDNINKEKDAWIQAGMDEAEATELAQKRIAKARQDAAEKAQEYFRNAADIEYGLTHTAFEKQLHDIELWKEAKIKAGEETSAIIANAAAKEAEAFEREVDRIKNLTQSLEDEIFDMENSQYEADKRRALQKAQKALDEGVDADTVQRYLRDKFGQLDKRAAESRKTGGDYTKAPEGAMQRGGNNIVVIGADQILDDGQRQLNIGLMTDEANIRARLLPNLDDEAKKILASVQATKELTDAQKALSQSAQNAASGFQLIEGDNVANESSAKSGYQQISGDQIISMPEMLTAELEQFGETIQQVSADVEQSNPVQKIAQAESALSDKLNQAAQNFPADYFKNLADGTKGVSEMQLRLTNSTIDLIDAQGKLKAALLNLPQMPQGDEQNAGFQRLSLPTDSFKRLSASSSELTKQQDLLARKTRDLEHMSVPKQDSGIEFGFDHDLFGTLATASTGLISLLQAAGAIAPHPAIKFGALALGGALGVAAGKGTFDATDEAREQPQYGERLKEISPEVDLTGLTASLANIDEKIQNVLQELQRDEQTTESGNDFSEIVTPLASIDEKIQAILQKIQDVQPPESGNLQELFGTLPNIESVIENILQLMQTEPPKSTADTVQPEIQLTELFKPLESIQQLIQSIRDSLPNYEPVENTSTEPVEFSFRDLIEPLKQIDSKAQNILQAVQERQFLRDDKGSAEESKPAEQPEFEILDYSTQIHSIDDTMQAVLRELQSRQSKPATEVSDTPAVEQTNYLPQLNSLIDSLQNIFNEVQKSEPAAATLPTEIPTPEAVDYLPQLNSINGTLQDVLSELQRDAAGNTTTSELDLSNVTTPLSSIDTNIQNILREVQKISFGDLSSYPADNFQEFPSKLANIESYAQSILQEMQAKKNDGAELFSLKGLDLSAVVTPLDTISEKVQSIFDELQSKEPNPESYLADILSEKLNSLPNIERGIDNVLQRIQTIEFPTETIVTPLNTIASGIGQILTALSNREPPQVNISSPIHNNLGGAYVFDEAMKNSLVNDITNKVVTAIKDAVTQATSKTSYGYSA